MILKRLKLRNYRQHADLDIKLEGTIIAVVGSNGSGKSNLLGAIQYAFTGEQTGFKKAELLRWGTSEGEVVVEFDHNGTVGEISRSIHSSSAYLRYGTETFRGSAAVTDALRLHLDLDKDLMKQAVFVRQAEIDAILFTDPRARELAFQRLMGIGDANKIHKVLGDVIAEMGDPTNYDEQITDGKRRYTEMHARLQGLQAEVQAMTAKRSEIPGLDVIKAQITRFAVHADAVLKFTQARQQLTVQDQAVAATKLQLDALPPITGDIATYDHQIAALQQRWAAALRYQEAHAAWQKAGEAVLALGTQPVAPEQLQQAKAAYDQVTAEINRILGRHKLHKDLLTALGAAQACAECPVCGSPITDIKQLQNRLTTILQTIEGEGKTLRDTQQQAGTTKAQMERADATFQQQYAQLSGQLAQATQYLQRQTVTTDDMQALQAELARLTAARQALINLITTRTSAETAYQQRMLACKDYEQRLRSAYENATTVGVTEQMLAEDAQTVVQGLRTASASWEQAQSVLQGLDTDLARLDGTVKELSGTLATLDKTIAGLEYKRSTQQVHRDVVATMTRVRDWFHYGNGPHTLSSSVLGAMNQDVNKFLGQFTAPFTVEPSSDSLGFRCHFTDGRMLPPDGAPDATMLSGGQKIQLAIAFRFAAYCMFASKLGLLSLDEPTVYLDSNNVGRFCDLLQQIKRVAQGMNLQVLIATHERGVIPFVDTVIDLSNNDTVNK
jgi:DNA repair exonuclease SbcCD ATPase subunit